MITEHLSRTRNAQIPLVLLRVWARSGGRYRCPRCKRIASGFDLAHPLAHGCLVESLREQWLGMGGCS
jgi:hypothetical protein